MFTDLKWKIPLILFVVLGSAFLAYPLQDKIALGLDLQGGMHLVLEVQTEKAVEASLERIASDIKREIENEDYEVDRVSTDLVNKTVTVLMVDAMDLEPVEEIMKNYTAYMKSEGAHCLPWRPPTQKEAPIIMKVRSSVRRMCMNCKIVRRRGVVRVVCKSDPRHKQRQGR